jgi:hypothetical protein
MTYVSYLFGMQRVLTVGVYQSSIEIYTIRLLEIALKGGLRGMSPGALASAGKRKSYVCVTDNKCSCKMFYYILFYYSYIYQACLNLKVRFLTLP